MSNILLTPSIIARESLMVLQNNMVLGGLVYKDYSSEFANVGDTITVRKPATFVVNEFTGAAITVQDAKESGIPVQMDKHLDLSFRVTSKDLALNIQDFSTQFVVPAMQAFAQDIDSRISSLYVDVPYTAGTAGVTPNSVSSVTGVRKVMNDNKVPLQGRNLILDTAADASLLQLDTFNRWDASNSTDALQEAQLGRKFGYDIYMDQNIKHHVKGALVSAAPKISNAVNPGDLTAIFNDAAMSGTIKKGDIFTVAGDTQTYVVTADTVAAGNAAVVTFYPAAKVGWAATSAVSIVASHTANLAFHKNAFSMVTRQLALPMGAVNASYINYNGLGLRVVMGYDMQSKSDLVSIDLLCGFKTMIPELACRLLG